MRVLLVSSSSGSRGGGEIFLLYLAEALRASGHTVGLWVSRHARMDELAQRFAPLGDVIRADYRNTYDHWHRGLLQRGDARAATAIREAWLAWRPDVVHLNKQNLEDGLDLLDAAAALGVPHLCTIHITQTARFLGARFPGWRDANSRRALHAYRGPLVAVAPARAAELRDVVGASADVRVVVNGVPPTSNAARAVVRGELRATEGLRADALAIVAVGRVEPQKCPLRFLDFAGEIHQVFPDAQLRWIGSGRLAPEWDRTLTARQLGAFVRRIDWRNDVRSTLPAYDLMLHPAAYEGLSLALLEAMDAGVPCAVMPAVHAELPAPLQACTLTVRDPADWRSLLGDRAQLAHLGRQAQAAVRAGFTTTAMARAYEEIYAELCRGR